MAVAAAVGSVVNNATIGSASAKRHSPIDPRNAELLGPFRIPGSEVLAD